MVYTYEIAYRGVFLLFSKKKENLNN